MKTKKNIVIFAVLALFLLGIFQLEAIDVQAQAPRGTFKGTIHWSMSADWIDPATGNIPISSNFPLYLFHDALFKPMADGMYTPCLAESWKMSEDGKTYDFNLRKGVKFHNGDTLTAEDVIFTFKRYKGPQAKFIQDKIDKMEAVTPHLFRIKFKTPFPDFPDYLLPGASTMGWITPKKYIEKAGDAAYKRHPIGCGPYKFVEFVAGEKLVGEAFKDFWRKTPGVNRMEFYIVREIATRYAMLLRGEVDLGTLMADIYYEKVKEAPNLTRFSPKSSNTWQIHMPSQFNPKSPWSDPRVRKAASLAIDRKLIIDVHYPGATPIGTLAFFNDPMRLDHPPDPYDPKRAKELLAEAGYPNGFDGGMYYPYDGTYWPMGEQVNNYFKAVGINLKTVLIDRPNWIAERQKGKKGKFADCVFTDVSVQPTIGTRLGYLFGRSSYGNYPDIQALWDQYNKTVNMDKRKELIMKIQKSMQDRTMFINMTYSTTPVGWVTKKIKGNPFRIVPPIWFVGPFEDIELAD
jgi:peptide/nickel transport system substrate-binding protein